MCNRVPGMAGLSAGTNAVLAGAGAAVGYIARLF